MQKRSLPRTGSVRRGAVIDSTGKYRYGLEREWETGEGTLLVVMLNPSKADDKKDDPTIRKCMTWARKWGFRCLEVVNVFAYRDPDANILRTVDDPVGPENDSYLEVAAARASKIVVAWGSRHHHRRRIQHVLDLLRKRGELWCVGTTTGGFPKHPLYLRNDATLLPFSGSPDDGT